MMRVTRGMIRQAKSRGSKTTNNGSRLSSIPVRSEKEKRLSALSGSRKVDTAQRTGYEKLQSSADHLAKKADALSDTGKDSLWEKAKESGDRGQIGSAAKEFVSLYNDTLGNVKKASGVLNEYYYKMLKEVASDNSAQLEGIGITITRDGSLDLNEKKFREAETAALEKVFGGSDSFMSKTSFLAGRISDNAASSLDSISGRYNSAGLLQSALAGRYTFRG